LAQETKTDDVGARAADTHALQQL